MVTSELAKTPQESRLKRTCFLAEAMYWRQQGNRKQKRNSLSMARCERDNGRYFLGNDLPF